MWEATEIALILKKNDRSKGLPPAAHVAAELFLCLPGVAVSIIWIHTEEEVLRSSFEEAYDWLGFGDDGWVAYDIDSWLSVGYFWGAMVMITSYVD